MQVGTTVGPRALNESFLPLPLSAGGHRQTLGGHLARRHLSWREPVEDAVVSAPGDIKLLLRISWQPGPRHERPAVILVHGLEGCDASGYVLSAGELAYRAGCHVIRMNLRGCGDSLRLCPVLYNAGVSEDLLAVMHWASARVHRVALVGFSLGANLALLTLARHREDIPDPVAALVAVSPPVELAEAADALDRPSNYIYQRYFLTRLRASYRRRQRLRPDLYRPELEKNCRSLWEYDERITAHYAGYRGARDYYQQSSAGPHLSDIDRPVLILSACDDPLIPTQSLTRWSLPPQVRLELTETGGHVGFLGRSLARGSFWAADRTVSFVRERFAR
ncbi:MAG: YheT family hydrolase [Vicinamibacteria bacterium]